MQLPIGAEDGFLGLIDLIKMKAIYWDEVSLGLTFEEKEIPSDLYDSCLKYREQIIEAAAEANDELMDKYLLTGSLTDEDIVNGVRIQTLANKVVPAFCGSAFKNKGVQALLDAVIEYLPSPLDIGSISGINENDQALAKRLCSDDESF